MPAPLGALWGKRRGQWHVRVAPDRDLEDHSKVQANEESHSRLENSRIWTRRLGHFAEHFTG